MEDCAEDDFGEWATDEVTSEQGYIDDERSFFLGMGRQRVCLAVQTFRGSSGEEKKRQRQWLR